MKSLLPEQVYAGLFEIIKNKQLYYHSTVGSEYCRLTEDGEKAVLEWVSIVAPHMLKLSDSEFDLKVKQLMWSELKK